MYLPTTLKVVARETGCKEAAVLHVIALVASRLPKLPIVCTEDADLSVNSH